MQSVACHFLMKLNIPSAVWSWLFASNLAPARQEHMHIKGKPYYFLFSNAGVHEQHVVLVFIPGSPFVYDETIKK